MAPLSLNQLLLPHFSWWWQIRTLWKFKYDTFVLSHYNKFHGGNKKSCRASHHIRHESFEMLDGLLPLVLLPFSVDLFGLFWPGLLHLPLPLSETGLDTSLPLQLSLLLDVHALWRMTHVVCVSFVFWVFRAVNQGKLAKTKSSVGWDESILAPSQSTDTKGKKRSNRSGMCPISDRFIYERPIISMFSSALNNNFQASLRSDITTTYILRPSSSIQRTAPTLACFSMYCLKSSSLRAELSTAL